MRIISLSVDGIHQAAARGLYSWLAEQDADVICLQDLRCLEHEINDDVFYPQGYNAYFFDSGTKHYSGVAIYTRTLPKALIYGFGFSSGVDMGGRYLQVDFDDLSIGSLLAPSAIEPTESQDIKATFFSDLQSHLVKIARKRRDFIFCGAWGLTTAPEDISDSKHDTFGLIAKEQNWMQQLPQIGYSDAFRQGNRDKDEYSWWPTGTIDDGIGLRTDLQVVSASLSQHVEYAMIYKKQQFSSHLPVIVDYDMEIDPEDFY